ncbi:hypothetical protein F4820DRAFT_457366 [Hypoxylon rubiginosum]|uniref:Uncharacterized protein n=1 Tax=Hypoxylon rubiginosum TaxID=110542 RepID=A0ACB9Z6Y0_9PEZI|nr:hypothetical protein F4820DRAFT_457366 [Hypoxylon rubiginosum]
MAGPNVDAFQRALERFKQSISPGIAYQFSLCTLEDVRNACGDIQKRHGQEGKLRNMRRLQAFIEAMDQLGKVVEVFVNANEFVCFIWGPIKFVLNTTFEEHPPLATVLEDYYSDILEFHQAALSVFKRPKWKEMFHSTWKTFDSKFKPIMHSLRSRRELLESEKGSATLYEIHKLRRDVSAMRTEQKQLMAQVNLEKHKARVSLIREKLQAPNYQIDQEIATEDRQGYNSGTWIFERSDFQAWSRNDTTDHSVLYINGIPGAEAHSDLGKTTLMSAVIEKLLDENRSWVDRHCVAYFYFKHKQQDKETFNGFLRAILDQLVNQDPDISDHLFPDMSPVEGTGLRSTGTLQKLVKLALESYRFSYVILDGLDECAPGEASKSIKWFLSLVDGGFDNTTATLRVLFCGQRDGVLDKMLADRPSISLETSGHVEDINRYCRNLCEQIREKFDIPLEMKEDIVSRVTNGAQGMFLYARVVLRNLLGQTKLSRLRQEIEPGTFPQGIEKAYERVAVRVFENSSPDERDDATKILGWITCAGRLLRWREIQSLFCIDPVTGNIDYEGSKLVVTCKHLCGSLVDVHQANIEKAGPEDIIRIVHETAREYLIRRSWLNTCHSHARLAIFCSRYLTSNPFALVIDDKDIIAYAIKGYYALQDYAVQYWFDHFRKCLDEATALDPNLFKEAMESARDFLISYGLASKVKQLDCVRKHDEVARILNDLPQNGNERNAYFSIEFRTAAIRKIIEAIKEDVLDPAVQEVITCLHGTTALFKCSKPWCEFFTAGFESIENRKRHADQHDLPFSCPKDDCFAFKLGYDNQLKLHKHMKHHHPEPDDGLEFPKIANSKKKISIWAAIENGDLATVRTLVDSGFPIEKQRSISRYTPLYEAAKSGCFEICKFFIERGASINSIEGCGETALHAAVRVGDLDIVRLFVSEERCSPDTTGPLRVSPFGEACALGHLDIVKLLFETGKVETNWLLGYHPQGCKNTNSMRPTTPFGYACIEGHVAVVQYLLQQNQPQILFDGGILARAAYQGHSTIVDMLLVKGDWLAIFDQHDPRIPVLDTEIVHTLNHESAVGYVKFSHCGEFLATVHGMVVRVYEVRSGETICALQLVSNICSMSFGPNGRHLATGTQDGFLKVWDLETQETCKSFRDDRHFFCSLDFSRDGRLIASINNVNIAQLWDVGQDNSIFTFAISGVTSVAISPNSRLVATGSERCVIIVWDVLTRQALSHLKEPGDNEGSIYCIAFTPDSSLLASCGLDNKIKTWDHSGEGSCVGIFRGHEDLVTSVAITRDGNWILSGSSDCTIRFWDRRTGTKQLVLQSGTNSVFSIATSPTGNYFATSSRDGRARIWSYRQVASQTTYSIMNIGTSSQYIEDGDWEDKQG